MSGLPAAFVSEKVALKRIAGSLLVVVGLAFQGLGWLLDRAGWLIECAGNELGDY